MSVQAIAWAIEQELTPGAKLTLILLANRADEEGHCWSSQERLAQDGGQGVSTVRRHLFDLEAAGLIERTRRRRRDGTWSSDDIRLSVCGGWPAKSAGWHPPLDLSGGTIAQIESYHRSNRPSLKSSGGTIARFEQGTVKASLASRAEESSSLRSDSSSCPSSSYAGAGTREEEASEAAAPTYDDDDVGRSDEDLDEEKPPELEGTERALASALADHVAGLDAEAARRLLRSARRITSGLDTECWRDPTGTAVPVPDRPRLLRLALLEHDEHPNIPLRGCLRYVTAQQMDPLPVRPVPRAPNGNRPAELPQGDIAGRSSGFQHLSLRPAGDVEKERREEEDLVVAAWSREHAADAAALHHVLVERFAAVPGAELLPPSILRGKVRAAYRLAVLLRIRGAEGAPFDAGPCTIFPGPDS